MIAASNGFTNNEVDHYLQLATRALNNANRPALRWSYGFWQSFWAGISSSLTLLAILTFIYYAFQAGFGLDFLKLLGIKD